MTVDELAQLVTRPETHRMIVGDHGGPYSLGVTHSRDGSRQAAFLLKIADPAGIPRSVVLEGETIPVLVEGGFQQPVPLAWKR